MASFKSLLIAITTLLGLSSASKYPSIPKGECTPGFCTAYTYAGNGACGYHALKGETGPGYLYGIAPNQAFYNLSEKCGICYEIVGPKGAVRAMVVDMCPNDAPNSICNGDHIHFDLTKDVFKIIGYEDTGGANITIREVSCDVEGPVKVKVIGGSSEWWMSLLVFNHALGLTKLEYYRDGQWIESERSDSNLWVLLPSEGKVFTYPFDIRITSRAGTTVNITIESAKVGTIFSSKEQFDLGKPASNECCEQVDSFTTIYDDELGYWWYDWSFYVTNNFNYTSNPHSGKYCLETAFGGYGQITIGSGVPALITQYHSMNFWIRGEACEDCFTVKARNGDNTKEVIISVTQSNVWEKKNFTFESIGIKDGKFYGLVIQERRGQAVTYYFDDITLDKNDESVLELCAPTTEADGKKGAGGVVGVKPFLALLLLCLLFVL